ncbi:MAG: T9SS type A sorting domain-containing protein [Ferruginibacter sp.]
MKIITTANKIGIFIFSIFISGVVMAQPTATTPIAARFDIDGNGSRDNIYIIGANVWVDKLHNGTYSYFPGIGANKIYHAVLQLGGSSLSEIIFIQERLSGTTYTYTVSVLYAAVTNGPVLKKTVTFTNTSRYSISIRDMDAVSGYETLFYNNFSAQLYTFSTNTIWKVVPTYGGRTPPFGTIMNPGFNAIDLGPGNGVSMLFFYHLVTTIGNTYYPITCIRVYKPKTKTLLTVNSTITGYIGFPSGCMTQNTFWRPHTATTHTRIFTTQDITCPAVTSVFNYQKFDLETGAVTNVYNASLAAVNAARTRHEKSDEDVITVIPPLNAIGNNIYESALNEAEVTESGNSTSSISSATEQLAGTTSLGTMEEGVEIGAEFSIFPNPASEVLNISLNNIGEEVKQVVITDILGHIILKQDGKSRKIDIKHLVKGVYGYHVETTMNSYNGRLLKQ